MPLRGDPVCRREPTCAQLVKDFHARHLELFGFADDGDEIEIVAWRAVCRTQVADDGDAAGVETLPRATGQRQRSMGFRETGRVEAPIYDLEQPAARTSRCPARPSSKSSFTTIVVHPGARAARRANGGFVVDVRSSPDR